MARHCLTSGICRLGDFLPSGNAVPAGVDPSRSSVGRGLDAWWISATGCLKLTGAGGARTTGMSARAEGGIRAGGRPCRRCGTPIRRGEAGLRGQERLRFWVSDCQR